MLILTSTICPRFVGRLAAPVVAGDDGEEVVRQALVSPCLLAPLLWRAGKEQVQSLLLAEERAFPPRPTARREFPQNHQLVPRFRKIARPADCANAREPRKHAVPIGGAGRQRRLIDVGAVCEAKARQVDVTINTRCVERRCAFLVRPVDLGASVQE